MDYSVYSINTVSNEKVAELIDQRKSFVLEDVGRLNMTEAVATLEKVIESKGLKCQVYTKGRMATMAAAAIPISPTVIGGWAAGIAMGIHNLATWNPDYEIAKNAVTGTLTIDYKR